MLPVHVRPAISSSSCAGSNKVKPTAIRGTHIVRPGLPCSFPQAEELISTPHMAYDSSDP
ncbi:hypothetical protein PGT21_014190 [Puccinia graminis f. sp. tritici]|uniref:Uncharacterized protein n=1 Tax=Puccinia graminis f. sp. tritici TaxID=56615 RepID=A0A5B0LLA1_PUCGR|nr:hypothetical protein PGTUg99_013420 [Puccinia graminis f. sp. tritici]KAA1090799.1 hypothetical protein PGT21_014190 [Puccinia graminis f. sp. tritici]